MVSVMGFLGNLHNALLACYYCGGTSKPKVLVSLLLDFIPRSIRKRYPFFTKLSKIIRERMIRNVTIRVWGVKYSLFDYEYFAIVQPYFESWIWNYLKPKKGDVFVDVGAHIGKYTCLVAKIASKVIALEPHPVNYHYLVKNIRANHLDNVIALNVAAWKENSELKLYSGSTSGRHSVKYARDGEHITVKARRIDDILEELNIDRVDWVKIDVEGAEYEVLQGMERTLRRCRCKLILECRRENLGKVISFLRNLGYRTKIIKGSGIPYLFCYPL